MKNLRQKITDLYREDHTLTSAAILQKLGIEKPTPQFWRILEGVQIELRGGVTVRRTVHNARGFIARGKEPSRFIPPKPLD